MRFASIPFNIPIVPDRWKILFFIDNEIEFYRIMCGFSGGYMDAENWRISSEITKIEDFGDYYAIKTGSSVYHLNKHSEGYTNLSASVFNHLSQKEENILKESSIKEAMKHLQK